MKNQSDAIEGCTLGQGEEKPDATDAMSRRSFAGTAALAAIALAAGTARMSATTLESEAKQDEALNAKIRRARLSGPSVITKDATVAEIDAEGKMKVFVQGTNKWICTPGDENKIGDPPMCADPVAMQWFADIKARKPKPTNAVPGMAYMLCGATQHSNTNPFDKSSPAIRRRRVWPSDDNARQRSMDDVR